MPRVRRALVGRRVAELLRDAPRGKAVDVERIAKRLGVDVRYRRLDEELSGLMQRNGQSVVIGINREHGAQRQRFTLAHELGHYLLNHGDTVVDNVQRRDAVSSLGVDLKEMEANAFAAELLMPSDWIRDEVPPRLLSPLDEDVIRRLAKTYRVSTEAMTFRLMNLGLMEV